MEIHANTSLPPEIMVEIFLLLPLDSILTCKLVSKEWNHTVKHPMFIKLYRIKSTAFFLRGNRLNCLFRNDDNDSYKVRRLPIKLNTYSKGYCKWHPMFQHELLVESSNKIACVKAANGHFYLHNLFTGDSRVVADPSLVVLRCSFPYWLCYGFGYDSYDDDNKIIAVCQSSAWTSWSLRSFKLNANSSLIFVYSYRNRRWKVLEGFLDASYMWFAKAAYSFNGVLYWVVKKRGTNPKNVIAAFDLHSYGLAEIVLPPTIDYNQIWNAKLTELDGDLCCLFKRSTVDVWVMKESWTKLFSIRDSWISVPFFYEKIYTLGLYKCADVGKIGVFLCHDSKLELFRYDIGKDVIQVFSKAPRQKRMLLQRLKTRFKKACCLLGDG